MFLEVLGESLSSPCLASKGHPLSLVGGFFLCLHSQQHWVKSFSSLRFSGQFYISHLPLSCLPPLPLARTLVIYIGPIQIIQNNHLISKSLTFTIPAKSLLPCPFCIFTGVRDWDVDSFGDHWGVVGPDIGLPLATGHRVTSRSHVPSPDLFLQHERVGLKDLQGPTSTDHSASHTLRLSDLGILYSRQNLISVWP